MDWSLIDQWFLKREEVILRRLTHYTSLDFLYTLNHCHNWRPLSERSRDWFNQAKRDLENAKYEFDGGFFDFSCFLSQQAADMALKSLYQRMSVEAFGHSITGLIQRFPLTDNFDEKLLDEAKELDKAYIPTRYPDSIPEGSPFMMYSAEEARRLMIYAGHILKRSEDILSKI